MRVSVGIRVLVLIAAVIVGVTIGRKTRCIPWAERRSLAKEDEPKLTARTAISTARSLPAPLPGTLDEFGAEVDRALSDRVSWRRECALHRAGESVAVPDIPRALIVLSRKGQAEVSGLWKLLIGRWAQADPRKAIAFVRSAKASRLRYESFVTVYEEWVADAPDEAVGWVSQLPRGEESTVGLTKVLGVLARRGPRQGLAFLDSLTNTFRKSELHAVFLENLAELDPAAAAQASGEIRGLRPSAFNNIASIWAGKDARAALAWAQSLPQTEARVGAIKSVVDVWARSDPERAAAFALSQPRGRAQDQLVESIAIQWASGDPSGALKWAAADLSALPSRTRALESIVERWAETDPEAAFQSLQALGLGAAGSRGISVIARAWAEQDPESAKAWFKNLSPATQAEAGGALVSQLAWNEPGLAADFATSLPESTLRAQMIRNVAWEWAARDLSGAVDWLKALPSGLKGDAFDRIAGLWAAKDIQGVVQFVRASPIADLSVTSLRVVAQEWALGNPKDAAAWASSVPEGQGRDVLISAVADGWAKSAPGEAAAYVAGLPAGGGQNRAAIFVVNKWATSDPEAASAWVGRFPNGDLRDRAAEALLIQWCYRDPVAAAAWATRTGDQQQVERQVQTVAQHWLRRDKTAAQVWIDSSGLPEEMKKRLLGN